MKKTLIAFAAILVIAVGAGFLTQAVYNHYQQKIKTQPAPVATVTVAESNKRVEAAKNEASTAYQALIERYNQQTSECSKGLNAYAKLSASIKAATPAPTCAPAILEAS